MSAVITSGHSIRKLAPGLAWSITAFGLLLIALGMWFSYLNSAQGKGVWYIDFIYVIPSIVTLVIGGFVAARIPKNAFVWVFLIQAFGQGSLLSFGQQYAIYALSIASPELPFGWHAAYLSGIGWLTGLTMFSLNLLLFPTGKSPSPRWKPLEKIIWIASIISVSFFWTYGTEGLVPVPNPYVPACPFFDIIRGIGGVCIGIILLSIPASAISLIMRFKNGSTIIRQQLKWVVFAAAINVLVLASDFLFEFSGALEAIKESIAFMIFPIAVAIAMFRHNLWDIDLVIRRTLAYSILTSLLGLVYFGGVSLLQGILTADGVVYNGRLPTTSGGQPSAVVIVVTTLAIAAIFNPLRKRIQDFIDRRFYRQKYDSEKALAEFAAVARNETDLPTLTRSLERVVQETVQPKEVRLWFKAE